MHEHKNANEMGTKSIGRLLLAYSLPSICGMVIVGLNQIISSIYIGYGIGPLALASMAVTFPIINLIMAFCQLVAVGCATLCSIELGRKNQHKANSMLGHVVIMELTCSILFGLFFWFTLDPMLLFFGASDQTLKYAHEFMVPLILGVPIGFLTLGFNFLARATGYPKTAMVTSMMTSLGIIMYSPIFINWLGWGMYGAALAQVLGQTQALIWLIIHFCRKTSLVHFTRGIWTLCADTVRRVIAIGTAPFLINACACVVVIIINRALLQYGGDMAVGAFGILNRLLMLVGMSVVGLGQGMQPIIGFNFGANNKQRVRLALKYGMLSGALITLTGMLGALLCPEFLVRIFTDHEPLVEASTRALRLAGMAFVTVGPQIMVCMYFQSIGQAKLASFVSLFRQVIFLIPALFILPLFLDLDGVWLSMPLADTVGCIMALYILWAALKAEDNTCQKDDDSCTPPPDFLKPKPL